MQSQRQGFREVAFLDSKPTKMTQITATVQRTIGEASQGAAAMIERCVDAAIGSMQSEELQTSGMARMQIAAAWRELVTLRKDWTARFPDVLRTALEDAATGADRDAPPSMPMALSSLSLVEDGEISRTLQTVRLSEQLNSVLDRQLRELDALMSAAMGLPGVQPDRNPLRPQVFARALRELMGEPEREPDWPGLWLRFMAPTLAHELGRVYGEQTKMLTQAKIQAAGYRVLGTPGRPGGAGAGAGQPNGNGPASGHGGLGASSGYGGLGGTSGHGGLGPSDGGAPGGDWQQQGQPAFRGSRASPLEQRADEEPFTRGAAAMHEMAMQDVTGPQLQDFLFRGGAQADWNLARSYYEQVDQELAQVEASPAVAYDPQVAQQYVHMPAVDRPARQVGVESPLPSEVWGAYGQARERSLVRTKLKKEAKQVGQVLGLEVVRKLVQQVAQDARLLAPVREAIVALEPSLLRLAMVAPRFFSDEEHPGRRLVECVADRSFKYNDEFSVDFQAFFSPVSQAFTALNAIETFEDAEPFRVALEVLQAGWSARDELDTEEQADALDQVKFAEQRQAEADRIAWELGHRSDLEGVPDPVQGFLFGPWALVMAHARLTIRSNDLDPGGYVGIISDLLWTVKEEHTLREPAKAIVLIPRVLTGIRKGMAMIGREADDPEMQSFFGELERLHRPLLRLRARQRKIDLPPEPEPPAAPPPAADKAKAEPGQIWMAPQEKQAAGFDAAAAEWDFTTLKSDSGSAETADLSEDQVASIIARLAQGSWVDMYAKQQWRRAQLVWAAGKGTLFMFVSNGGQPHSMTKRILQRLVRERLVRPVDADAVVPRALRELATA
jgi:hypothetical protein